MEQMVGATGLKHQADRQCILFNPLHAVPLRQTLSIARILFQFPYHVKIIHVDILGDIVHMSVLYDGFHPIGQYPN